ncbi:MAG: biotin--protein ligase [Thermomicrobiales bacterium]|nr:biotin--protein ligase [Thermomicrobiales bacterium]
MGQRGEFKTPGGKLVAVEFDVTDGVLRDVVVTGDFFLYPEEALPMLARGLEGSPASLSEPEFATRVAREIEPGVELLGTSPEGIAVAVMRALQARPEAGGGR